MKVIDSPIRKNAAGKAVHARTFLDDIECPADSQLADRQLQTMLRTLAEQPDLLRLPQLGQRASSLSFQHVAGVWTVRLERVAS